MTQPNTAEEPTAEERDLLMALHRKHHEPLAHLFNEPYENPSESELNVMYLEDLPMIRTHVARQVQEAEARAEKAEAKVQAKDAEIMAWRRVCMQTQGLLHMLRPLLEELPDNHKFRWKELVAKPDKVWDAIKKARALDTDPQFAARTPSPTEQRKEGSVP